VKKLGDEPANTYGIGYRIPVQVETLPIYVTDDRNDHLLNYPSSDVLEVLAGKKSFQDALGTARQREPKRVTANRAERFAS